MKLRITHLKAPWPPGAGVGDVVELDVPEVPGWALGKCQPAADDAEVFAPAGPAMKPVEGDTVSAEDAAIAEALQAERIAGEAQVAAAKPKAKAAKG